MKIILNLSIIFVMSIGIHYFVFSFVFNFGIIGISLINLLQKNLKENIYLFFLIPFFASLIILFFLHNNMIFLDSTDVVHSVPATFGKGEVEFTGEFFNSLLDIGGSAAVFAAGARIAASLVSTDKMGLIPQVGAIGGIGSGLVVTYKLVSYTLLQTLGPSNVNTSDKVPTPNIEFRVKYEITEINHDSSSSLLDKFIGKGATKNSFVNYNNLTKTNGKLEIKGNLEQTKSVLEEVKNLNPDWKIQNNNEVNKTILDNTDSLNINWVFDIDSPLEKSDLLNNPLLNEIYQVLSLNLSLHFIMTYLLFLLSLILLAKYIVDNKINLDYITKLPLGKYIHYILMKYISILRKNGDLWVFFITSGLFIFSLASTFSLYHLVSIFN